MDFCQNWEPIDKMGKYEWGICYFPKNTAFGYEVILIVQKLYEDDEEVENEFTDGNGGFYTGASHYMKLPLSPNGNTMYY